MLFTFLMADCYESSAADCLAHDYRLPSSFFRRSEVESFNFVT